MKKILCVLLAATSVGAFAKEAKIANNERKIGYEYQKSYQAKVIYTLMTNKEFREQVAIQDKYNSVEIDRSIRGGDGLYIPLWKLSEFRAKWYLAAADEVYRNNGKASTPPTVQYYTSSLFGFGPEVEPSPKQQAIGIATAANAKWNSLTPAEKQKSIDNANAKWNSLPPAEKQQAMDDAKALWNSLSPAEQQYYYNLFLFVEYPIKGPNIPNNGTVLLTPRQQDLTNKTTALWNNLTPAEKQQIIELWGSSNSEEKLQAINNATAKWNSLTQAEKQQVIDNAKAAKAEWNSLTPAEKQQAISNAKALWNNLTEPQPYLLPPLLPQVSPTQQAIDHATAEWNRLTPTEKQQSIDNAKALLNRLTPTEKQQSTDDAKALLYSLIPPIPTGLQLSPTQEAIRDVNAAIVANVQWNSLTPVEKRLAIDAANANLNRLIPAEKQQAIDNAKAKWNSLTPAEKQLAIDNAKALWTWNRLTIAEQQKAIENANSEWNSLTPTEQQKATDNANSEWNNLTPTEQYDIVFSGLGYMEDNNDVVITSTDLPNTGNAKIIVGGQPIYITPWQNIIYVYND